MNDSDSKPSMSPEKPTSRRVDMLDRFHALIAALLDHGLSKADARVMAVLCDHADAQGIAWPSLGRIAAFSGVDRKNVGRSLRALRDLGYVDKVESGSRCGRSTRNRLTLMGVEYLRSRRSDLREMRKTSDVATLNVEGTRGLTAEGTVPSHVSQSGLTDDDKVASDVRAKPTTEPTSNGREVVGAASGSCPPGTPSLPTKSASTGESADSFGRFWDAYPKKRNQQQAKAEWDRQVRNGVSPAAIIQGAVNYAQHVESSRTQDRFQKWPRNFLSEQAWTDDYAVRGESRRSERDPVEISKRPVEGLSPSQQQRQERFWQVEAVLREHVHVPGFGTGKRLKALMQRIFRDDPRAPELLGCSLGEVLRDVRVLMRQVARGDWGDDQGLPASEEAAEDEDASIAWLWFQPSKVKDEESTSDYLIRAARAFSVISQPTSVRREPSLENPAKRTKDLEPVSDRVRDVVDSIARGKIKGYHGLMADLGISHKQARLAVAKAVEQNMLRKHGRWFEPVVR